jgi:hypothetical protein
MSPVKDSARTREKIELIRKVLIAPPETTNDELAAKYRASREWIRRVRRGIIQADLFPELPRITESSNKHLCSHCVHFIFKDFRRDNVRRKGVCGLGHNEAESIGIRYGIGCGAFMPRRP